MVGLVRKVAVAVVLVRKVAVAVALVRKVAVAVALVRKVVVAVVLVRKVAVGLVRKVAVGLVHTSRIRLDFVVVACSHPIETLELKKDRFATGNPFDLLVVHPYFQAYHPQIVRPSS